MRGGQATKALAKRLELQIIWQGIFDAEGWRSALVQTILHTIRGGSTSKGRPWLCVSYIVYIILFVGYRVSFIVYHLWSIVCIVYCLSFIVYPSMCICVYVCLRLCLFVAMYPLGGRVPPWGRVSPWGGSIPLGREYRVSRSIPWGLGPRDSPWAESIPLRGEYPRGIPP